MQEQIQGLSESQAAALREQGQANAVHFTPGRTYLHILRKNAFTFINCVLFAIGILLILLGQLDDAVVPFDRSTDLGVTEYDDVGCGPLPLTWTCPILNVTRPGEMWKDESVSLWITGEDVFDRLPVCR